MTGGIGAIVWLVAAVVLFVIESATVQMVCVWFAVGALLAMLASALGAPLGIQLLVFVLASVAVLAVMRPIVKKKLQIRRVATNADQVIGQIGIVREEIDNIRQVGRVTANGLDWAARTRADGVTVPAGARVLVHGIEGVKLIVSPVNDVHTEEESV